MGRAQEACGSDTRRGEEDRVDPLSTNRNKVDDPQSLAPEGLPWHDPACCVLAPGRWHRIDVVATPCIRGRGAGNATYGESLSNPLNKQAQPTPFTRGT